MPAYICTHWADGGRTEDIARKVVEVLETGDAICRSTLTKCRLGEDRNVAKEIYRADGATAEARVMNQIKDFEDAGR